MLVRSLWERVYFELVILFDLSFSYLGDFERKHGAGWVWGGGIMATLGVFLAVCASHVESYPSRASHDHGVAATSQIPNPYGQATHGLANFQR